MTTELDNEEIERLRAMFPNNFQGHLKRVRRLLKAAQPGNAAWHILENEYGFQGDWSPSDAGEPPKGAKW